MITSSSAGISESKEAGRNLAVNLDGSVASRSSRPAIPVSVDPGPANAFVLPPLGRRPYDESKVVDSLNFIFANFPPASQEFSMYFQLMPQVRNLQDLFARDALNLPPGTDIEKRLHPVSDPSISIHGIIPRALGDANLDVFQLVQPSGSTSGPKSAIFIVLDGFATAVPVSVANLLEANFISGFVTRLVLGQFKAFWSSHPAYGLAADFTLDLGPLTISEQSGLRNYADPATYPSYRVIQARKTGNPSFDQDISIQLASNPLTSIGMLYGWSAAEQLEQADGGVPNHQLLREAFKLLGFRFSLAELGEMTGFSLNYLCGASQNTRIADIAQGTPTATITDLGTIIDGVGQDPNVVAAKEFLIGFENVLVAEFYAISQNANANFQSDRPALLTQYFNFINGFHRGVSQAADALYKDTLNVGFGLGYNAGFRDGYSLGYATGYQDGFAAGNQAAWAAANKIINGLQAQIADLQNQLAQARSGDDGGGSGSGFWDTVGHIESAVNTAIAIIGLCSG